MNQRRRGQALVEYVLAVLLCLAMASVLENGIKKGISKVWCMLAKDIAGGCPYQVGCTESLPEEITSACP